MGLKSEGGEELIWRYSDIEIFTSHDLAFAKAGILSY